MNVLICCSLAYGEINGAHDGCIDFRKFLDLGGFIKGRAMWRNCFGFQALFERLRERLSVVVMLEGCSYYGKTSFCDERSLIFLSFC
jgi:hypothetical protein